jgi:hypothetical protein
LRLLPGSVIVDGVGRIKVTTVGDRERTRDDLDDGERILVCFGPVQLISVF